MDVHKLKVTFISVDVTIFCELFSRTLTKDPKHLCKHVKCPPVIRWRANAVFPHWAWADPSGGGYGCRRKRSTWPLPAEGLPHAWSDERTQQVTMTDAKDMARRCPGSTGRRENPTQTKEWSQEDTSENDMPLTTERGGDHRTRGGPKTGVTIPVTGASPSQSSRKL